MQIIKITGKILIRFQLTEVMRQRGDSQLLDLLSNVRTGDVTDNINILKSRVIQPGAENYPHNALHIFAENTNAIMIKYWNRMKTNSFLKKQLTFYP